MDHAATAVALKFWKGINNLFWMNSLEISKILSMKKEDGWVIVSKGKHILATASHITDVLEDFGKNEEKYVGKPGIEKALDILKGESLKFPKCSHIELVDIRSRVQTTITCPHCKEKMRIKSVCYECCHGHHDF